MQVHHGVDQFDRLPQAVVTSGTFDGVHIGHRKILARLTEISREQGGSSVVITFWPHPRLVVSNDSSDLKLLSTIDEKIKILSQLGVDHFIIIPFTKEFSQLSSDQFVRQVLVEIIGTKRLVIGHDHRFGKNREGSFDYLVEHAYQYGFEVEEIPRQDIEEVAVSSTRIREALLLGNVKLAANYLGRPYSFSGEVVLGNQLGRTIGFPTANLVIPEAYKLIPANGVYAVEVTWNGQHFGGMLNIGTRPTVDGRKRTIEVHIFEFDHTIYQDRLTVHLIDKLREEEKFGSLDQLKHQLGLDRENALQLLKQPK